MCIYFIFICYFSFVNMFECFVLSSITVLIVHLVRTLFKLAEYAKPDIPE